MNKAQDTVVSEKKATDVKPVQHDEALIDQAVAETFPASDPISPAYEKSLAPVALRNEATRWRAWIKVAVPYVIAGAAGAAIYALVAALTTPPRSRFDTLRATVSDRVRRLTRR